jgi:hypothetical protein
VTPIRRYVKFVGVESLVVVGLLAVGFLPTRRLGGEAALPAMVVGGVISLVAAALAGWPLVIIRPASPVARMQLAMLAMIIRLGVVVALALAAALSGVLQRTPLLFWLAASYVALLPLEVKLAVESS